MHPLRSVSALTAACLFAASAASAQTYNDGHGREWRQLPSTIDLTWNDVATVCPTDGVTPGAGSVGGRDLTGWTWATPDQVALLFSYFMPEIIEVPCLGGPQYAAAGIYLLGGGYIDPTFAYYSTFGASLYAAGWTATLNGDGTAVVASASAQYPVFDGSFCVTGTAAANSTSAYVGVWLWRSLVAGDANGDGNVNLSDLSVLLARFGTTSGATRADGDFDADGDVDLSDLGILLGNFGCC
jgi:hypothetical protein